MRTTESEGEQVSRPVSSADWGGRGTRAEIDLDAIASNVRAMRKLAPRSRFLGVVKADAYGHGAVPVARAVLQNGADWLGVYTVDEGVELRQSGIDAPILVFGPFRPAEARSIVRSRLTPSINSVEAGESIEAVEPTAPVPFHVKIDTGLTRAGVSPADAVPLMRRLSELPSLQPEGLYTHFARADEPDCDETSDQLRAYLQVSETLAEAGFRFRIRHAANSGAILGVPEAHLDMVRCGISLYGYIPSPALGARVRRRPATGRVGTSLQPAMGLYSYIARLQAISPGTGVGYGHQFRCTRPTLVALVPIGYADGLTRSLGCGVGHVLIGGCRVPIVGRVSMDQIAVDVTEVPDARSGDPVIVIGKQNEVEQTADDIAQVLGTISYEVVAGIMPRVPRLYIRGGQIVATRSLTHRTS